MKVTQEKTTPEVLMNEIASDFNQYLMSGDFSSFANELDPNLNIVDIRKLLRIHFVLTKNIDGEPGVIDFIDELTDRLRRFKTTVTPEPELLFGEIKGHIIWNNTIRKRMESNPFDYSIFVCDRIEKNYDIPENLVLKSLLKIILDIVYNDLSFAFEEDNSSYKWAEGWFKDKNDLRDMLKRIYSNNVYLKRVNIKNVKISDRILDRALKSRLPLYRDAAKLHIRYNKLISYQLDTDEAKQLLKNTFIMPDKPEVLFELYWVIKILNQFENPKLHLITPGNNIIAEWESCGNNYKLFHNSMGSLNFNEDIRDSIQAMTDHDNYIGRKLQVAEIFKKMTGRDDYNLWDGRPDIVLEKSKGNKLISILIGEVKYTQSKDYAIVGLKQLLEYMALVKNEGKYQENYPDLFNNLNIVKGCLFIDNIEDFNIVPLDNLQIIKYGDDFPALFNQLIR